MPRRERTIRTHTGHDAASFLVAAAEVATEERDVIWIESHGQVVGAIIPARNYHDPDQCCCENCPWNGDHREPARPQAGARR